MVDEWTQTRCSDASIYKRLLISQTFQGACAVGVDAHPCLGSSEGRQGISRSSSRPALGTRPAGGSPVPCTLITAHLPLIRRQPPPLFPGLSVQKHPNRGSKSTGLARFTVARFAGCPRPHRPLWSRCGLQPGFCSVCSTSWSQSLLVRSRMMGQPHWVPRRTEAEWRTGGPQGECASLPASSLSPSCFANRFVS